jgi:hypothetical protein
MTLSDTSDLVSLNNMNGGDWQGDAWSGYTTVSFLGQALGICLLFGLITVFGATMEMQSRKYTEETEAIRNKVKCTEEKVTEKTRRREKTFTQYDCNVEYNYNTSSGNHTTKEYLSNQSMKPVEGEKVIIHYNPQNHKDIALNVSPKGTGMTISVIGVVCCVCCLWLLKSCFSNKTCFNIFGISSAIGDVRGIFRNDDY